MRPTDSQPAHASPAFAALSAWAAMLACWQVGTIALSLAAVNVRGLAAQAVLAGGMAAGGLLYFLLRRRQAGRDGEPAGSGNPAPAASPAPAQPSRAMRIVLYLFIALSAAVFGWLCFNAYVYPDWSWDGNAYHLPVVQLWAQKGSVHWVDMRFTNADLMNGYPKGAELVQFLLVRALADGRLDNVANLLFLPLGVLAVVAAGRALGAGRLAAWACGGAVVLLPVTINQAATTYVDSAYASAAMGLLACLVVAWRRLQATGRTPWSLLPALGCCAGLVVAVKPIGPLLAGLSLLACGAMTAAWAGAGQDHSPARLPRRLGGAAGLVLAGSALCFAVGGYWYVRNLYYGGSPLYPGGLFLAGRTIFPGKTVDQLVFLHFSTPPELRPLHPLARLAATWTQWFGWPANIVGHDARLGGLGYLWLVGCLPAIVLTLRRPGRAVRAPGLRATWLALIGVSALAVAATPMNWWARYTIWLYLLGLPCLALFLTPIARPGLRWLGGLWLGAVLLLVLAEAGVSLGYLWHCPRTLYVVRPAPAAGLDRPLQMFYPLRDLAADEGAFHDLLAFGDPVGLGPMTGENRCLIGQLSTPPGFRTLLPVTAEPTQADLDDLRRLGADTIVWDASLPLPPILRDLTRDALGPILLLRL